MKNRFRFHCLPVSLVVALVIAYSQAASAQNNAKIEFNRDIRPILSDTCFFCHGPDKSKREADLRLDIREGLLGSSDSPGAVVPGNLEDSELIQRIISKDPDEVMPPPDSRKHLSPEQIDLLKRWVAQGGEFEGHWAFQPLGKQPFGADAERDSTSESIDQLIARKRDSLLLRPAAEADRITLLRRLHFDLVGLPPTENEVVEFLADRNEGAYERVVDRLLASPHFGERLAIWWLDLVRYADSVGYHGDQTVSVSPYRDYVIDSFNSNKRFDEFTREQIAGDLLPNADRNQKIASGYNRLGMMSAEGGVQDREYLAKYIAERVRNVSGTWLGVTLGCAECHDHKFDPFTSRDFYRMEAFFADIKEKGLYAGANDDGSWGPQMKVPDATQAIELAALDEKIAVVKKVLDTPTDELVAAQSIWEKQQVPWTLLTPEKIAATGNVTLTARADGALLATGDSPATTEYTLTYNQLPADITAFRLEVLPDESLPNKGPGRASNGNFVLSEFSVRMRAADGTETPVALQNATATYEQTGAAGNNPFGKWAIKAAIDGGQQGKNWGWAIMEQTGRRNAAVFETATNLSITPEGRMTIIIEQSHDNPTHTLGCFRLSVTTAARPVSAMSELPDNISTILKSAITDRTAPQVQELAAYFRSVASELNPVRAELLGLEKQRKELDSSIRTTLVTESVPPRMVRVLARGNWMDEKGEVVTAGFPAVLAKNLSDDRKLTRRDLAEWIVSSENPLTPRVVVNRIWKLFFGAGLSRRVDDLGTQGDWPSHPDLLDFLAVDFRNHGWDLKRLIKSLVMSRTYQQSSVADLESRDADPENRWLARQGRFRLDAELVRDNALAISGLLDRTIGGRSVFPYQPAGYWSYLNFPTREWQNGTGGALYRRGLYTHWQRQYLHPSLMAFDAPSREECTADRPRSNTPLQSLVLLNDPSYVEAARAFAESLLRNGGDDQQMIELAFRRALSRPATEDEIAILLELVRTHLAEYEENPATALDVLKVGQNPLPADLPPTKLAAWTSVTRTILNLHEMFTRN